MNPSSGSRRAIVLLSGGIDSTTTLAIAQSLGFRCSAISFRYGQRHTRELEAAKSIADKMRVDRHLIIDIDLRSIGGSALTADIEIPKQRAFTEIASDIPITYVPARNTIFLSIALGWAEVLGCRDIFIGVNALDYSGYPDCRPEFVQAFEHLANLATKVGVNGAKFQIHTPLIKMTKAGIIRSGIAHGVDFSLTHSCYDPSTDNSSCGVCDSCQLRLKGFHEVGVADPVCYATSMA